MSTLPLAAESSKMTASKFRNRSGLPALSQLVVVLRFHAVPLLPCHDNVAGLPVTLSNNVPGVLMSNAKPGREGLAIPKFRLAVVPVVELPPVISVYVPLLS